MLDATGRGIATTTMAEDGSNSGANNDDNDAERAISKLSRYNWCLNVIDDAVCCKQ